MPAVSGTALSYVVFGAVAFSLLMSLLFLVTGNGESLYDQIGAGGLSREGEHAGGAPAPTPPPSTPSASARSARCCARAANGSCARASRRWISTPRSRACWPHTVHARARTSPAPLLEVRQLVVARNERRQRRGLEPLDVESEMRVRWRSWTP